jgi:hypothetical protein
VVARARAHDATSAARDTRFRTCYHYTRLLSLLRRAPYVLAFFCTRSFHCARTLDTCSFRVHARHAHSHYSRTRATRSARLAHPILRFRYTTTVYAVRVSRAQQRTTHAVSRRAHRCSQHSHRARAIASDTGATRVQSRAMSVSHGTNLRVIRDHFAIARDERAVCVNE